MPLISYISSLIIYFRPSPACSASGWQALGRYVSWRAFRLAVPAVPTVHHCTSLVRCLASNLLKAEGLQLDGHDHHPSTEVLGYQHFVLTALLLLIVEAAGKAFLIQ